MTLHLISHSDLPPCGDTPPLSGGSKKGGGSKEGGGSEKGGGGDNLATIAEPTHQAPTPQAKAGKGKTDLYQSVTDSIIKQLEAGAVPWVQPWGMGRDMDINGDVFTVETAHSEIHIFGGH